MKKNFVFLFLVFLLSIPAQGLTLETWQKPLQPGSNQGLQAILPDPSAPGNFIVASEDGVFKGPQNGPWDKISLPSGMRGVQKLFSFQNLPDSIFLIPGSGVYACGLSDKNCSQVFRVAGRQAPKPLTFSVDSGNSDHWFVGTEKGLEESDDHGKTWFRFSHFRNEPISVLASLENRPILGAGHLLFLSEDSAHFKAVFSSFSAQSQEDKELEDIFVEDGEVFSAPSFETLIKSAEGNFYIAGSKGVFESRDLGKSWKALPSQGLSAQSVSSLAYSPRTKKIFAGSDRGIFIFNPASQTWSESYAGLDKTYIRGLTLISSPSSELLGAVTSSGFFFQIIFPAKINSEMRGQKIETPLLFQKLVHSEPSSWQVQHEAIKFANVKNRKIKQWQTESRIASLVPSLYAGKDFDLSNNIDIDRGGTSDLDKFIAGPSDKSRGWNTHVSWNLADLIFSLNQTSIDSREKLMVELRNDILAEVTRIYYERRRLQMDACFNPAATLQEHMEKILRIDELTSLLDGFTGREFSKKIDLMYGINPELKELWEFRGQIEN